MPIETPAATWAIRRFWLTAPHHEGNFRALADARHTRSAPTSPARLWRVLSLGLLGVWLVASPASSAELVQVRVGNHPTFTRVVFEFDAPAGYRLERHAAGEADNVIVVTLGAATRARDIASRSPGVERVTVEAGSDNSVARIVTRKRGLPIKEMILSDPPRVVLDLMLPVVASAHADEIEPAPAVATPQPEPAPVLAAEPEPEPAAPPEPVAEPESELADSEPPPAPPEPALEEPPPIVPEPMPVAVEPAPAPVAVVPVPEPGVAESEFEPDRIAEPVATEPAGDEPADELAVAESVAADELESLEDTLPETEDAAVAAADAVATELAKAAAGDERAAAPEEAAEPSERRPGRVELPAVPAPVPEPASTFDEITMGAIAGGVLALLLVVFLVARSRRALPPNIDVTSLSVGEDEEAGDAEHIPAGGFAMDSPIAGSLHEAEDFELASGDEQSDENKPIESIAAPGGAPGLFEETSEKKEAMTMENQDLPTTRTDSDAPTQMGIGASLAGMAGDSDIARLVQELERRVAHMETRLDESIDARERLERQVAAQSEELRVQRAAIARTQRALRSLNRSEEEQATEPALRDPSKPAGPQ